MKKILFLLLTAFLLSITTTTFAGAKMDKRHAYTLKNLKLDKKTQAQFSPILMQYLQDKKEANKKYDDLKALVEIMGRTMGFLDTPADNQIRSILLCTLWLLLHG